jgi:hypothetical protein
MTFDFNRFFYTFVSTPICPMKYILSVLLIITCVMYTKAQVASHAVTGVPVVYHAKHPSKINSDSTAIFRSKATGSKPDGTKIIDGKLSSDRLAKDILSSLQEARYSENQKIRL